MGMPLSVLIPEPVVVQVIVRDGAGSGSEESLIDVCGDDDSATSRLKPTIGPARTMRKVTEIQKCRLLSQ